jgi:hypothetical protein
LNKKSFRKFHKFLKVLESSKRFKKLYMVLEIPFKESKNVRKVPESTKKENFKKL